MQWIEVRDEVPLSEERPRMDFLFLRKKKDPSPSDTGKTLVRLWPLIPKVAIAEFKSISRPYRTRELDRLFGYMHTYFADASDLDRREDLVGVLIVADRTPALDKDVAAMGLEFHDMQDGYWELKGGLFRLYVLEIDRIGELEPDGVLSSFGHHPRPTREAAQFWTRQMGMKEAKTDVREMEGYDEVVARFLAMLPPEQRLEGLAPQERLAGLAPQERLAGLAPQERLAGLAPQERLVGLAPQERLVGLSREEVLLALPDDELRRLPESYLATFPESVREAVRMRIGG